MVRYGEYTGVLGVDTDATLAGVTRPRALLESPDRSWVTTHEQATYIQVAEPNRFVSRDDFPV